MQQELGARSSLQQEPATHELCMHGVPCASGGRTGGDPSTGASESSTRRSLNTAFLPACPSPSMAPLVPPWGPRVFLTPTLAPAPAAVNEALSSGRAAGPGHPSGGWAGGGLNRLAGAEQDACRAGCLGESGGRSEQRERRGLRGAAGEPGDVGVLRQGHGAAATQWGPCAPKLAFCEPPTLLVGSLCALGCKALGGGSMDGGGWGVSAPCEQMGQSS